MPFSIVRNDITSMDVDAIVNTANPKPVVGAGTDSRVHCMAGPQLLEARKAIGDIGRGQAEITPGFDLKAKYVIHTVGPIWVDGEHGEEDFLADCYRNSLELAEKEGCESIAFPMISTGTYGFPKDKALGIAMSTISNFLLESEMMVYLVVFDKTAYALSEKLFSDVQSYINDKYVEVAHATEYAPAPMSTRSDLVRERRLAEELEVCRAAQEDYEEEDDEEWLAPPPLYNIGAPIDKDLVPKTARSLDDILASLGETFSESLLRLIDERGYTDPEVYHRANISRKLFNKIKNNPDYQPSKETAICFAIALRLNLDEAKDFIGRAGFAFANNNKSDVIVQYFLETGNYDMFELNSVLFRFDQKTLGV